MILVFDRIRKEISRKQDPSQTNWRCCTLSHREKPQPTHSELVGGQFFFGVSPTTELHKPSVNGSATKIIIYSGCEEERIGYTLF